jgi:hypothetical protein
VTRQLATTPPQKQKKEERPATRGAECKTPNVNLKGFIYLTISTSNTRDPLAPLLPDAKSLLGALFQIKPVSIRFAAIWDLTGFSKSSNVASLPTNQTIHWVQLSIKLFTLDKAASPQALFVRRARLLFASHLQPVTDLNRFVPMQ